jgi:hypothetical protein
MFFSYNVSGENALRCTCIQGNGQTDATGLTEDIAAQKCRSRQPAAAGEWAVSVFRSMARSRS